MFENVHQKRPAEPEYSPSIEEHSEQDERRHRESGKVVNSIVSSGQNHYREEIAVEKTDLIELEPKKLYEIPTSSKVPRDVALQGLSWNITERAQTALEENNIMAVIHACDQSFWLLDMREDKEYADAKVPYLLIGADTPQSTQKNDPHSYSKGIRSGDTLIFGRTHDYGGRFDYLSSVSREHFELVCKNGKVSVKDLNSTNGTSMIISADPSKSFDKTGDNGGKNLWEATPRMLESDKVEVYDEQPFIYLSGHRYPLLHRDATNFNGCVDANRSRQLDVLIDGDSLIIQTVYDRLAERCDSSLPTIKKLMLVEQIVHDTFKLSDDEMVEYTRGFTLPDGEKFMFLSDYVRAQSGVCRQRALLAACLLEKMQSDGLISGVIHVERNLPRDRDRSGHEWATFQEDSESDIYVIDPMHRFVGKKEDSPDWDYRRS